MVVIAWHLQLQHLKKEVLRVAASETDLWTLAETQRQGSLPSCHPRACSEWEQTPETDRRCHFRTMSAAPGVALLSREMGVWLSLDAFLSQIHWLWGQRNQPQCWS